MSERELATHRQIEGLLDSLEARERDEQASTRLLLSLVSRVTDHIVELEHIPFPRWLARCPFDTFQDLSAGARNTLAWAPTRPRPPAPDAAPLVKLTAHARGPWERLHDLVTPRGT